VRLASRREVMAMDRLVYEREARANGHERIAGVDEVGRAAWAGPMVAAAVILGEGFDPDRIRSSKKMSPGSRLREFKRIEKEALTVAWQEVSAADIDARGIDVCHMELLRRAVKCADG
jgi:ribonuclease HII